MMTTDFARAMRRATDLVRARKLGEATALIRAATTGRARPDGPERREAPQLRLAAPSHEAAGKDTTERPVPEAPRIPQSGAAPSLGRPRRPLGEVIAMLRKGHAAGAGSGRARTAPAPEVPDGASFSWRKHASAAGARDFRLFVPSCSHDGVRGLIVMLHGCTQHPDDFAVGTGMNALAEQHRLVVAYPAQSRAANVSACWNWFDPGHQSREAGEPAILAGIAREVMAEFEVPADRAFVAGLSAGGAMAAVLAETHPELFAAAGIHSGLAFGAASDVASAFAAMRGQGAPTAARRDGGPRLIVFHGTADRTVHPSNAAAIVAAARAAAPQAAFRTERGRSGDGRRYTRSRLQERGGPPLLEAWAIEGAGHAWSGGNPAGSHVDPGGPAASAEMVRFFLAPHSDDEGR